MFFPFLLLITAGAQDYASEVLYPDDLIPVEDIEGKFDCIILFSNPELRSKQRHTDSNTTNINNHNNNGQ